MNNKELDLETLKQIKFACNLYSDSSSQTLGYDWICNRIEELERATLFPDKIIDEVNEILTAKKCDLLMKQLDIWINACKIQAEIFESYYNMETSKLTSEAMMQAYQNVKNYILSL